MITHIKELIHYRDLLFTLAWRDIRVRYRQTFMGVAWALLQPLSFMLILTGLKAMLFSESPTAHAASDHIPYPVFLYVALVPWMFFTNTLNLASNSVAANMNLVKKIYFPREVFPMGVTLGAFIDFLVASSIVLGMLLFYKIPLHLTVVWVPVLVLIEVLFLLSIVLFTSALNVFYRDVKYIIPLLVQLGMFATPVLYSVSLVPEHLRPWYMLNPMAVVITGMRQVVLQGQAPDLQPLLTVLVAVMVCFLLAYRFFKKAEVRFADLI
jgi:lipopolysaccharide transport system permease protein